MKNQSCNRLLFLLIASISFIANSFCLETICKFEVCRNTITGTNQLNLPIGNQEIWVYGKYADLVESITCNDIEGFLQDAPVEIRISKDIINKRGSFAINSCETGIRLDIGAYKPSSSPIKVKLFGNIMGVKTQTFEFTLNILPTPDYYNCYLSELNGVGIPHDELIEGKAYKLSVAGINLENIRINPDKNIHKGFFFDKALKIPGVVRIGNVSGVAFEVIFKKRPDYLGTPIEEFHFISEVNGLSCPDKKLLTRSTLPEPSFYRIITSSTALTPLPELVDAGLNRKFGAVSAQCSGSNVEKVSTNRTTLDIVRAQIPAPTSGNPVVYQDVTWPNIKWGVKNIGVATPKSFTIQLKDGDNILQSQTLNGLGAGEERLFTYERPKSQKRLYRSLSCNPNQDVFVFNKAIRSEADLRMMEPYIWSDPAKFTIVIDAFKDVQETDESNNTQDY